MSLRTALIIAGVFIVIAVYLYTAIKRRRDSRGSFGRRFSRIDIPDVILDHNGEQDEDEVAVVFAPRLPDDVVLPREEEIIDDLPAVLNDAVEVNEAGDKKNTKDQLDLFPQARDRLAVDDELSSAAGSASVPKAGDSGVLTLYVRARKGQQFSGTDLVKALNGVGMQFGDMSIFHHFGAGDLKCEVPVFSAANMFEPGTFDLGKIEAFRTSGLALFMQLPGPLDGPVAFELLLNTAQRLATLSGGDLFAEPRTLLDSGGIARLRDRAGRYGDAGA
ncbi:MAG: cell division protein ZipA [Gammaproteobacteria bacterium]|nr:cell division protein ZipA [Gammaproteobacteria bacterium]